MLHLSFHLDSIGICRATKNRYQRTREVYVMANGHNSPRLKSYKVIKIKCTFFYKEAYKKARLLIEEFKIALLLLYAYSYYILKFSTKKNNNKYRKTAEM